MKQVRSIILALFLIPLPILSFAATRKSITVSDPITIGSTELKPGDYKVQWDGNGPTVQVSFIQGNKTVATAPASVQQQSNEFDGALELKSAAGGDAKSLHAIDFKHMALVFDQGAVSPGQ